MGKHFFVNGDKNVGPNDRLWVTTSDIFHTIFDRIEKYFGPHEQACKEKCFEDTGIDGIDLDFISTASIFFIFAAKKHWSIIQMRKCLHGSKNSRMNRKSEMTT